MLLKLLGIYALAAVLSGCSEEPNANSNNEAWAIHEPQLVSNSRGVQYSMKELAVKRPTSIKTSDYLLFSGAKQNIILSISSVCSKADKRTQHHADINLKRQLYFSEITPTLARLTNEWVCSYQFTAKNKDGSEHYFELNQYIIDEDAENSIHVTEDTTAKHSLERVYLSQGHNTYFLNQGIGQLNLTCDEVIFTTDQTKAITRLNEFLPNNQIDEKINQKCRAFEITKENLVVGSSNTFWIIPSSASAHVEELIGKRHTYKTPQLDQKKTFITWSVQNKSNSKLYLVLPKALEPELFQIMTFMHFKRTFNSESFYMPIHWHSNKKNISHNEHLIYELHKGEYLELYLSTHQKWLCGIWEHGVSVLPGKNNYEMIVTHDYKNLSNRSIVQVVDLNFYNQKWIGMSPRNHNALTGEMPKAFGPEDNIGTMPVKASTDERVFCKTH